VGGADEWASRGAPEARAGGQVEAPRRRRRGGDAPPGGGADKGVDGERGDREHVGGLAAVAAWRW